MSKFTYTTEHRKGEKHGNADRLSKRACIECRQCERIEQRDGGPSHLQLAEEEEGATLHDAGAPELAEPPPPLEEEEVARVEQHTTTPAELQQLQSEGDSAVATMYRALLEEEPLKEIQLSSGGRELRQLNQRRHALRIGEQGLLEIRVCPQNRARWCVVCPTALKSSTIWQAHSMAHSGISRTLGRIQLAWY